MNIYDSLYTSLDETTKVTVSSLFGFCVNMHMQPLQRQVGGTDCGLLADVGKGTLWRKNLFWSY